MSDLPAAKNVSEITNVLLQVFNGLTSKQIEPKDAVEINNTAGKIASFLKVQLAYHQMRGEKPDIEFLNAPPTTKTIEHKSEEGEQGLPKVRQISKP
jgi:hypothetical protein